MNEIALPGQPPPPPSDGTRFYTLSNKRSIYFTDEGEIDTAYQLSDAAPANVPILYYPANDEEIRQDQNKASA